jgi:hypothetical protein
MKAVILNLILIILIAVFSLPFLALYLLVFFGLGGGWAYAGPNGCHFVIGPIGYGMIIVPAFALSGVAWRSLRKLRHRP